MTADTLQQWLDNPANLALLSSWVGEMQAQSSQEAAVDRLTPVTDQALEESVAAAVYSALFTLEFDLGRLKEANRWVKRLHDVEPDGFRCPHFHGLILKRLDRIDEASNYFLEAVKRSETWIEPWRELLDCCTEARDFDRAKRVIERAKQQPWEPRWRRFWSYREGCVHQQMARYSLAMVCFTQVIHDCVVHGIPDEVDKPPRLSQVPASAPLKALRDATGLFEGQGLRPFPTAGTLLGWWREDKFLAHDKDIDVMLPEPGDWAIALEAATTSPLFTVLPNEMGYANFRSLLHNETQLVVDISHHEKAADGRVRCVWRIPGLPEDQCRRTDQASYRLVRDRWLGCEFWRPEDPDKFLTELYGDWRTPMPHFDTVISGQHLMGFPDMVRCYGYNRLAIRLCEGRREKSMAYVSQILDKDPCDPVANFVRNQVAQKLREAGGS
jgi:tetratricopeptide (TPR) repeat protein